MPPLRERGRDVITSGWPFPRAAPTRTMPSRRKRLTAAAQEALLRSSVGWQHPRAGQPDGAGRPAHRQRRDHARSCSTFRCPPAGLARNRTDPAARVPRPSRPRSSGRSRRPSGTCPVQRRASASPGTRCATASSGSGSSPAPSPPAASQADSAPSAPAPVVGAVTAQGLRWERRWITAVLARLDPTSIDQRVPVDAPPRQRDREVRELRRARRGAPPRLASRRCSGQSRWRTRPGGGPGCPRGSTPGRGRAALDGRAGDL